MNIADEKTEDAVGKLNSLLHDGWEFFQKSEDGYFDVFIRKVYGKRCRTEYIVVPEYEGYSWLQKSEVIGLAAYMETQVKKLPLFEYADENGDLEIGRYERLLAAAKDFYTVNSKIKNIPTSEESDELIDCWTSLLELFYSQRNHKLRRRYYKLLAERAKRSQHERVVNHPNFNSDLRQRKRAARDNPLPKTGAETNAYQQVAKLKNSKHPDLIKMRVEYDRANQTLYLAAKNSRQISMRFDDLDKFNNYFEKPRVISGISEDEQAVIDTHKRLASIIVEKVENGIADEELALTWIALYKHWDKHKTRLRKALDSIRKNTNG